jgi:cell wall assembly regulator SMI1
MRQIWRKMMTILTEIQPEVTQDLYPPSLKQLAELESWLGEPLPEDLRHLYKMYNGQGQLGLTGGVVKMFNGGIFEGYTFLPLPRVAQALHYFQHHPNWIPFASDERGGYLCVDLTPGVSGQILEVDPFGQSQVLAENFSDYLENLLQQVVRYYRLKTAS